MARGRVGTDSREWGHRVRGARGARIGTETRVREHSAGAQGQSLTNGRHRGADDGAGARSEISHSCEPVPNVLPNVDVHEWEHSDSHETVPAARADSPERQTLCFEPPTRT